MQFYSHQFLQDHIKSILAFYDDVVIDPSGGYFQNFYDNKNTFNQGFKQLVSSTRIVVNYALASIAFDSEEYRNMALHGLNFLEQYHWQEDSQTYAWTLQDNKPLDMTQQAYGYAFVLLAYSAAKKANLIDSDAAIEKVYNLLEERFWLADYELYADEISPCGELSSYRGQNANMHLCEAMIAAYEATENKKYLNKAMKIANNIAKKQADLTQGLIWEHYTENFEPDWEYNKEDPKNLYRPWGFQPGHQTEWTKLLLILYKYDPQIWLLERATSLFDKAFETAWDHEYGGLIYGYDPDGNWCDTDKYFWVQAESFAAAALLYKATNDEKYLEAYQRLWKYSWEHMVDHTHGAWFRVLEQNNTKYSNEKSAAGAKCDYHTLCACLEVLNSIKS